MVFVGGKVILFAVNRSARRSEDDLFDAITFAALEEVQSTKDVDRRVEHRIFHRFPYIHLCGVVVDNVDFPPLEDVSQCLVPYIDFMKFGFRVDVFQASRRKIVNDDDGMTRLDVGICNM